MITYTVTHPQLSEPVVVESEGEHTDTFIANNVWHYILRTFDEMVDRRAFTVERSSASTHAPDCKCSGCYIPRV